MFRRTMILAVLGVLLLLLCDRKPAIVAGDPGTVLKACKEACASLPGVVDVTFRRHEAKWRPTSLDCSFRVRVTDAVVAPLTRFTTLERLTLAARGPDLDTVHRLSARGIRGLASPRELRRLALPWAWIESDLAPVCAFTMLDSLDLHNRQLGERTASDDLDRLKVLHNLRKLNLVLDQLDDKSVDRILALTGLEDLTLRANEISDAGLAKLKALRNLRVLAISRLGPNTLNAIRQIPRLDHLSVEEYRPLPETADLSVLTDMKWLTILNISPQQPVRIRLPATLRRLDVENQHVKILDFQLATHVEHLELDVAVAHTVFGPRDFTPLDSKWLGSLRELRELTLIDPTQEHVNAIAGLKSLRALTLRPLEYASVLDEGMRMLAGLKQLESLTVADNYYGRPGNKPIDEGLDVLPKLPRLRRLALTGFPMVTAKGLENVWKLTQLRALRLSLFDEACKLVDDAALAHIGAMSELEELSIGESGGTVTDKGLKNLATLTKLRRLDLGSCRGYTDEGLASLIRALPNLQELKRTYTPPSVSPGK